MPILMMGLHVDWRRGSYWGKLLCRWIYGEWNRPGRFHNGWIAIGDDKSKKNGSSTELCFSVRAEPDPRFVFQFDGEPECSPQVSQVQGNVKQTVFTCKFGFRHASERNLATRSSEPSPARNWPPSFKPDRDQFSKISKERKGWGVTIHDLSGSPVAMASMVTPYVPSPGSNRISRCSPGVWLILRPGGGTWKPWGHLETWRDPNISPEHFTRFPPRWRSECSQVAPWFHREMMNSRGWIFNGN